MSTLIFTTDHDPFPAKAGNNLVNNGSTARTFSDSRSISGDVSKTYTISYLGGNGVVDSPQEVTAPISYVPGTNLTGVAISDTTGQFTCSAATLKVGDIVTISGTFGGSGSINNYSPGIGLVSAVTGTSPSVTGFTLTTSGGSAITTTAGTPTGLTYGVQQSSPETLSILLSHAVGITSNGVLIMPPFTRDIGLFGSSPVANAPLGFNWDVVHKHEDFNLDPCDAKPIDNSDTSTDIYTYRSGKFLSSGWDSVFTASSSYYTSGLTHADGHSKIVGISFDGYPIYGPKGYATPTVKGSVVSMTSSYRLKTQVSSGRVFSFAQQSNGSFIQDYEYVANLGSLDEHNGRYCVTPDYPNGTYAYFISTKGDGSPSYPYIIGPTTKAQRTVAIT